MRGTHTYTSLSISIGDSRRATTIGGDYMRHHHNRVMSAVIMDEHAKGQTLRFLEDEDVDEVIWI